MIRIFITAVLYFIAMFTQAQENPVNENLGTEFSSGEKSYKNCVLPCNFQNSKVYTFKDAKFEVRNKDLTFEIRF